MKPFSSLLLFSGLLTGQAMATPASELESLALLRSQFNQLQTTLSRAEAQARVSADSRFFFDYPRVFADLRTMREGVERYISPSRAQPQPVQRLSVSTAGRRHHDASPAFGLSGGQ